MVSLSSGKVLVFAAIAAILGAVGAWLWAVPAVVSPTTFALLAVFAIGGLAVSLMTWRNAQATGTVGQLLYATEASAGKKGTAADAARVVAVRQPR
jgi:hypothetical protein